MNEPTIDKNASETPAPSRPWWESAWFQGALLALLMLGAGLYYQFVPGYVPTGDGTELHSTSVGLPGADGYYHIKMAYLYRTGEVGAAGAKFHWTRESTWNGSFSDKDFLFHIYLIPFTLCADGPGDADGLVLGAKLGVSVLGVLITLTLFAALRMFKVRHAWMFTLMLVAVGGTYFVFRLGLCRSYLGSMILALAGWTLIARNNRIGLFFLGAVYTLAYTASHLLLAMLLVRTVMEFVLGAREGSTRKKDLKSNALLGVCIIGGIFLGCILHPHPLELVKLWWVQNVVVLALSHKDSVAPVLDNLAAIFGGNTDYANSVELSLGRELNPTDGPAAIFGTPLIFFGPMLLPLVASILRWRPNREAVLTATIAVVWFVAYMINGRFLEYAAPFMTLALGVWITGLLESDNYKQWLETRPVLSRALPISAAVIAMIAGLSIWVGAAMSYRARDRGDIEQAARYLHNHPETHGKLVWHDRWDDFTELMFFASECDYLTGLDPTYFLVHDEKKYKDWWDIKRGKRREVLGPIRDEFEADYILAHRSSSEYFYNRLNEEARAGKLKLLIRADNDAWALYEILPEDGQAGYTRRMDAETHYLIRHAILHDAGSRLRQGDDPERHKWAVEFMKTTLLSDAELNRHAAEMAHHARIAAQTGSPASRRMLTELELHFLNVAYRRALNEVRIPEAAALAERLVAHAESSPRDRADALLKMSVALRIDQRVDQAVEFARRALEAAVDPHQQAWARQELGNACNTAREIEEADEAYSRALRAAGELNDGRLESAALCNLGSIRRQQGRGDEAGVMYRRAIEVGREAGAPDYEGVAHLQLGYLLSMQGRTTDAELELKLALEVLDGTPKAMFRVDACSHLGDLAMRAGDFDTAARCVDLAMAIARELGYRAGLAQALNFAAIVQDEAGRAEPALAFLRESIEIAREAGDVMNIAYGLVNLGAALQRGGRLDEAEEVFARAEEAAQQARNPYAEAGAVGGTGDVCRKQGRLMEAWTKYEHAAHLMDLAGYPPGVVRMRIKLAGVDAETGDAAKACEALAALRDRAEELGSREDYESACVELARANERRGEWDEAVAAWQLALDAAPGAPAREALGANLRRARQMAAQGEEAG